MSDLAKRLAGLSPVQRELLERRLAERREQPRPAAEPIALIGMACRLPGASTPAEYWRLIVEGREAVTEVPPDRWDAAALYDPSGRPGTVRTTRGGFLDGIDQFDAALFGVTPREASRMDPQQRLLLEVAFEALEGAGRPSDTLAGTLTGVFVGIGGSDYAKVPIHRAPDYFAAIDGYMGTGNALSIAANRLSYAFDLRGPSLAVDTACSSSSVAIHLAVESLRRGECDAALAGGVNVILTPETTVAFSNAQMLSPDGRCRPFDAGANGYVRSEGCGLVVLKRLADALADGDHVVAVLRATAINQDGRTSGISAPNGEQQKAVIQSALRQARVEPWEVAYVEAHGTGTPLGDPIEMTALCGVFRDDPRAEAPLLVSSVKANIGHTETVSGVAGLIKAALVLRHGVAPAQLHLERLNPHVRLEGSRVWAPFEPTPLVGRRVAGVSSFGFGGANSHLVLEGAPHPTAAGPKPHRPMPLVVHLTGRTPEALRARAAGVAPLVAAPGADAATVCDAINAGQTSLAHRAAVVAADPPALADALRSIAAGEPHAAVTTAHAPRGGKTALLVSGQGAQFPGMGMGLYRAEPAFREALDRCAAGLDARLDTPLLELLHDSPSAATLLNQTVYTQPALFSLGYALAKTWEAWGLDAEAYAGHSIGEFVAATLAGAVDLEDALALVAERGRLMQQATPGGRMVAVFAPAERVEGALGADAARVAVAAINGPESTVISGDADGVARVLARLAVDHRELSVSHAFHSPHMDPVLDDFERFAERFAYRAPERPYASNVTGGRMSGAPTARYWRDHLRGAVRFAENVQWLDSIGVRRFVEAGPGAGLVGLAKRVVAGDGRLFVPTLRVGQDESLSASRALANLAADGARIDWRRRGGGRLLVELPPYPFQRSRYWLEFDGPAATLPGARQGAPGAPSLGHALPVVGGRSVFDARVGVNAPTLLADHVVQGAPIVPAAYFAEQALEAARETQGPAPWAVEGLRIAAALQLPEDGRHRAVQSVLEPESAGGVAMSISSRPADDPAAWVEHASCRIVRSPGEAPDAPPAEGDAAGLEAVSADAFYERMAAAGFQYGPRFRRVASLRVGPGRAHAELDAPATTQGEAYVLSPPLGDACLQVFAAAIGATAPDAGAYLPVGVDRVWVSGSPDPPVACHARLEAFDPRSEFARGDAWLCDAQGRVVVQFGGIRARRIAMAGRAGAVPEGWLHAIAWRPAPDPLPPLDPAGEVWLVYADGAGRGEALVAGLQERGAEVLCASPGEGFDLRLDPERRLTTVFMAPDDESAHARLVELVAANPTRQPGGVVVAWTDAAGGDPCAAARRGMLALKHLARRGVRPACGVSLVTENGPGPQPGTPPSPEAAAVAALARTARLEHPELGLRVVDTAEGVDAPLLWAELLAPAGPEGQVSLRPQGRFVPRLTRDRFAPRTHTPSDGPCQLRIPTPGALDSLTYTPFAPRAAGPGEVGLEVRAAGLNFSDVLKALGLYPGLTDDITPLGIEAVGMVTSTGPGVERFAVGDRVFGVAPYAFASHAVSSEFALAKVPAALSDADAAALPIAYLTAHYALVRLAQLAPGERVLIHAGAGGVGLAAIAIAQSIGAEVFATAGSEAKRDYLRGLGVSWVFDSRTLDFAQGVRDATAGQGVDVVLNSLPGEAITASLGLLRAYGRFLEIGKTDIYQDRRIGLWPFQDNLSYHAIDLDRVLRQRPEVIRSLWTEVVERLSAGVYRPLPVTRFPAGSVVDAFRYMQQRRNTGKVVVEFAPPGEHDDPRRGAPADLVRRDGAYLVTGGLGALGLELAGWLVEQGAGEVVLASRSAPSGATQLHLDRLRSGGAAVRCVPLDVADGAAVHRAVEALLAGPRPLRGVFHAAGVLDDGLLSEQTAERFDRVAAAKARGALHLDHATRRAPLDWFVMFSSIAAVTGSPGQGPYGAANAVLDALAASRRAVGLPATSINWGPWGGAGMAADAELARSLKGRGMTPMAPAGCLGLLERLLRGAAQPVVVDADWSRVRAAGVNSPLLDELATAGAGAGASTVDAPLVAALRAAEPADRVSRLTTYVAERLARVMSVSAAEVDVHQPLSEMGIDSLMSLELKNGIEASLGVTLPMGKLLEGPTTTALAALIADSLAPAGAGSAPILPQAWTPLVRLREGAGAPVFLLPTLAGDARSYSEVVSSLDAPSPVFALRLRGLDDESTAPHDGMGRLADDFADAIAPVVRGGACLLVGWSTGGIPAMAVAERLAATGRGRPAVVLIDTPLPEVYGGVSLDDEPRLLAETLRFVGRFAGRPVEVSDERIAQATAEGRFAAALAIANQAGLFSAEVDDAFARRLLGVGVGLIRAAAEYAPRPGTLEVTLVRPKEAGALPQIESAGLGEDRGWGHALGGELFAVQWAPGNHFTMMTGDGARAVAKVLAEVLARLDRVQAVHA